MMSWYLSPIDETDEIPTEWVWERLRARRDALLVASDWTQVGDAVVDSAAWASYRQVLRDLPKSIADNPRKVIWPTPPA